MVRIACLAFFVLAGAACIAQPDLVVRDEDATVGGGPAVPVSGETDEPMVLVPATVIRAPGGLAPNAPNKDAPKNEGNDKKGKGKDAGAPEPGEPPPASETTVPAFWLDAHEVSAASYAACVREGACTSAAADDGCTAAAALGAHPINCVALDQARAYCAWRGKRLPTNDEWTAASAGAAGRPYPWGAEPPSSQRLNACGSECGSPSMYPEDDGYPRTAPRGSFPSGRSPEGAFDLAGNVAEWVDLGGASVVRGGSFLDVDPAAVDSAAILAVPPGKASVAIGFRCAKDG